MLAISADCSSQIQFRKSNTVAEHSLWRFSRALHSAINERQPEVLETLIDDDVDWVIHGPIELFPFLGARRGKAAVLTVCRQISENVRGHRFDRESIILGEDTAASLMRYDHWSWAAWSSGISTSLSNGLSSRIWGSCDKEGLLWKRFRDRSWQA